ncbi:MAG: ATP-binding protein [Opitutaceae bacterium]|nr:ATP-binding protein [Opitutaceae bacterium]
MTVADLNTLLAARSENEHVEFKEAKNRFDFEKLVAYCVALANEGGGKMVLGVTDAPPRRVVGTQAFDVPERTVEGIHERLHMKVTWSDVAHPDGRVLVFTVPSRPVGHPVHYEGRYWMRAGADLVPMSPDQLKAIVLEGQPEFSAQVARDGLGEEEVASLLDVQSYYDLRTRPLPSTRAEIIETFVTKGFVQRSGGAWAITNLGALLFAKRLADFETVARKGVRVISYDGLSKLKVKDGKDVPFDTGYAAGFSALVDYIHAELPASEEIAAALRTTTHAYPKKAIREIVGNAIVHQDLTERGTGVVVELFDDRVEVTNPGLPILPVDRFIDENQSRNERFADALRQLRICDERGHGMDDVVTHIELHQLPPYQCRLGSRHTTVVLSRYRPLKNLTPEERIHAVYQHCCLRFVTNQATNNESLRGRFKIEKQNAAIASRLVAEAVKAEKIRAVDVNAANKLMRYVPYWA